jgi:Trypsin-co-occurring domain 1
MMERVRAAAGCSPGREVVAVAVLMRVPLDDAPDAASVLVETDSEDIPGGLVLASPEPGKAAATATRSLSASLEHLEPVLRTVKEKLAASAPAHFTVEFGVKLGGESGFILAKGTAEVNLKITMTWDRDGREPAPDAT